MCLNWKKLEGRRNSRIKMCILKYSNFILPVRGYAPYTIPNPLEISQQNNK